MGKIQLCSKDIIDFIKIRSHDIDFNLFFVVFEECLHLAFVISERFFKNF